MKRLDSPYPKLVLPPPYRPESEAPRPTHDTDPQELTDPETPMAILNEVRGLRAEVQELKGMVQGLANELVRHRKVERAREATRSALPWVALLVSLTAIAVSVYRMGEPIVVQVTPMAQNVVWQ